MLHVLCYCLSEFDGGYWKWGHTVLLRMADIINLIKHQ